MTTLVRRLLDVRLMAALLVVLVAAAVGAAVWHAEGAAASASPSPAQKVTLRVAWSMQQVTDGGQPVVVIDYPTVREALSTGRWDESAPHVGGSVSDSTLRSQSYIDLAPSASPSPTAQKSVSKASQLMALVLVLIATGVAIWLLVRRHRAALRDGE